MLKLSCSLYSFDPHKASNLSPLVKNRFLLNQGKFWKTDDYSGRFRIVMVAIKRNVTSMEERNFLKKDVHIVIHKTENAIVFGLPEGRFFGTSFLF
jgi:hypothetical protein